VAHGSIRGVALACAALAACTSDLNLPSDRTWRSQHFVYETRAADDAICPDVLGPLERKVMVRLWAAGPSTVAEVVAALNEGSATPLAYTTVMTVLARELDFFWKRITRI